MERACVPLEFVPLEEEREGPSLPEAPEDKKNLIPPPEGLPAAVAMVTTGMC